MDVVLYEPEPPITSMFIFDNLLFDTAIIFRQICIFHIVLIPVRFYLTVLHSPTVLSHVLRQTVYSDSNSDTMQQT